MGHAGSVIGVDDFAFRRGQRYGTIIVDHESGGVIDRLPDRTSSSLEGWFAAQPALPGPSERPFERRMSMPCRRGPRMRRSQHPPRRGTGSPTG
ncbi:transposase [Phycisphaerales bacterium AB-hyl4]|uniref:Transposase n=1 Tax=Natronomicrosphaera hydrolytica TaxID=3242702 RepID=A0ABV4U8V5_9BACT